MCLYVADPAQENDMHLPQVVLAGSMLTVCALAAVWDLVAQSRGLPEATVTAIIQRWTLDYPPILGFVFFTLGHLFWPVRQP